MTYVSPPAARRRSDTDSGNSDEKPAPIPESVSDRLRALAPETPQGWAWKWDKRSLIALGAILAVLMVIVGWWASSGTTVTEFTEEPSATEGWEPAAPTGAAGVDIVVHVAGEVANPGVFTVPAGSRVHEVIELAGGALKEKYLDGVNLARVLVDGEQIVVGHTASVETGISLNSASEAELDSLTGIGPALAARIVEWRTANGPFTSIDQLEDVSGIGPSLVASIRDQVRL